MGKRLGIRSSLYPRLAPALLLAAGCQATPLTPFAGFPSGFGSTQHAASPAPAATNAAPDPAAPSASPSPTATGNAGGVVVIPVPTSAPVLCSPSPVALSVGQQITLACSAAGYGGKISATVADPTIASVQQASEPWQSPQNLQVTGLRAGTTTLALSYGPPTNIGSGSVTIDVSP